MIKYIIVDDEPLAHELIEEFCNILPHLELQQNCYNALEAMEFLNSNQTDIMFLDLNMPKLKGFDFLKTLSQAPKVIVTTAYKEFALEGYELNIVDYLLKPFSFERLVKAINKATNSENKTVEKLAVIPKRNRFFLKGDKKYHQIVTQEILFIEAYGNYTKLFMEEEMIIGHQKISSFEKLLPDSDFLRVHKSFIVSGAKIKLIEGNRITIAKHQVPVGQLYKHNLKKLL